MMDQSVAIPVIGANTAAATDAGGWSPTVIDRSLADSPPSTGWAAAIITVTGGWVIPTVPTVSIGVSMPTPSVSAGVSVEAGVVSAGLSLPAPSWSARKPFYPPTLQIAVGVESAAVQAGVTVQAAAVAIGVSALNPGNEYPATGVSISVSLPALQWKQWRPFYPPTLVINLALPAPTLTTDPVIGDVLYRLYLTGEADGLDTVELPMSNFQFRRGGAVDYLSVTVPNAGVYRAAIAARPQGTVLIHRGARFADGREQLNEFVSAALVRTRFDEGSKSASATLEGQSIPNTEPAKRRVFKGISYQSTSGGTTRVRCTPDTYLRPGDTAVAVDTEFTVSEIVCYLTTNSAVMEVAS